HVRRLPLSSSWPPPPVGQARQPVFEESMSDAIDLRGGAQAAGDQLGRGLALDQAQDDLAPQVPHGAARPDALVSKDPPLAWGEALPSSHHLDTNHHEEL